MVLTKFNKFSTLSLPFSPSPSCFLPINQITHYSPIALRLYLSPIASFLNSFKEKLLRF